MRPHRVKPLLLQRAKELRANAAPAEETLWNMLRSRQLEGFKFRRQFPLDRFVVDFYCPAAKLAIELDGDSHSDRVSCDAQRTRRLEELGFVVIRFENPDVFDHLDVVLESILEHCITHAAPHPDPLPGVPGRGDKFGRNR
jgi:very-short-patch-repair endonuclease